MPKDNYTPIIGKYAKDNTSPLWEKLVSLRQELPPEAIEALKERARRGYKPVDIQEKYIDAADEKEFNNYKKILNSIPNDPNRNNLIAELGYKPVLRYKQRNVTQGINPVTKTIPRTSYELGFSTMPDRKITLNSEEEYNQAKAINDIDNELANVYQKRFNPSKLNRSQAYDSYRQANPQEYSKMFLNENDRNEAILNYARNKGLNPEETLNNYINNRDKFYPRDLVVGQGNLEQQGKTASNTNYGYRNYLTTMMPKAIQTQEQITENVPIENVEEKEISYPFKFGYKGNKGGSPPDTYRGSNPPTISNECPGGVCEKVGEMVARKNKYLFKKRNGGKLINDINNLLVLLKK